ncbi:MAG: entericidin A/B family lipoprotein [Sneathiella sp.]|nr:entericidin A/B family lipoprotein [Sneathiella sp.]
MLTILKKTLPLTTFGLALIALAACNTVEGAGKDIEEAGNAIEEAASED